MITELDAIRTALTLSEAGMTDSDALTAADIFEAAILAGAEVLDDEDRHAVRVALDVLTMSKSGLWRATAFVDGVAVSDWGAASWETSQQCAVALKEEFPAATVQMVPAE